MKKIKRFFKFTVMLSLFICLSLAAAFSVFADSKSYAEMPHGYGDAVETLPDGVKDTLPSEMLEGDSVGDALVAVVTPRFLFQRFSEMLSSGMPSAISLTCLLTGLVIISAIIRALISSTGSNALLYSFRLCSSLAVFSTVIAVESIHIRKSGELLSNLNALMESMIPITGVVWAMGGNVSTASAGSATLYAFLAICEGLCSKTIIPVCLTLTVAALCSAVSPDIKLGGIANSVKKAYNFTLGFVMSLLVTILGIQTTLTSASDGLGAKAAKMVTSSFIPVVGGSVGDTLRSVAASAEYIKSVFGISVIIFIAFLVMPTIIGLLMTRAALSISGGVADMLGCEQESRLLSEMNNIYGCMIGVCAMSSVMFILGFTVFVKTTVAIA